MGILNNLSDIEFNYKYSNIFYITFLFLSSFHLHPFKLRPLFLSYLNSSYSIYQFKQIKNTFQLIHVLSLTSSQVFYLHGYHFLFTSYLMLIINSQFHLQTILDKCLKQYLLNQMIHYLYLPFLYHSLCLLSQIYLLQEIRLPQITTLRLFLFSYLIKSIILHNIHTLLIMFSALHFLFNYY